MVQRCLDGDKQAWDEFFRFHQGTIVSVAAWKKWGFDRAEQQELVQDIMIEVITSLKGFEFRSQLNTFVHKIAVCKCIARLRHRKALKRGADFVHVAINPTDVDHEASRVLLRADSICMPDRALLGRESVMAVRTALAKLGDRCRELIQYRYFRDFSFREIADETGEKENTVIVNMRRCLVQLLRQLQGAREND